MLAMIYVLVCFLIVVELPVMFFIINVLQADGHAISVTDLFTTCFTGTTAGFFFPTSWEGGSGIVGEDFVLLVKIWSMGRVKTK